MTPSMKYVLITGTNSGLGLGICIRLLDEFLRNQPSSSSLTLIFTTRSARKSKDTQQTLLAHLSQHHPPDAQKRVYLRTENVELTNLLSIRELSQRLLASDIPHLNAIILNAGIGGWAGIDWPTAIRDMVADMVTSTTWPKFKIGIAGMITERQLPALETKLNTQDEPPLGQIFCANIFGHYILVHSLMALLCACEAEEPGRIIWTSSIEATADQFDETDWTGLTSHKSYESSKRLTDVLALTYGLEATKQVTKSFTAVEDITAVKSEVYRKKSCVPTMHTAHPGICITAIAGVHWLIHPFYVLGLLLSRVIGSPWHTVSTYVAAMVFTWLVLAPASEIHTREAQYGNNGGTVKWGSAVRRLGQASVQPTEVEDWGLNGSSDKFGSTWWSGRFGRAPGSIDATKEEIEEFVALGGRMWTRMERLRVEWERRIEEYDRAKAQT